MVGEGRGGGRIGHVIGVVMFWCGSSHGGKIGSGGWWFSNELVVYGFVVAQGCVDAAVVVVVLVLL